MIKTKFGECVSAPNSSHGFHGILFYYIDKYKRPNGEIFLISEPNEVIPVFEEHFPSTAVYALPYDGEHGKVFTDLCKPIDYSDWRYDIVLSQATLEHVCRPSVFLENLVRFTKVGGHVIIHTHNPRMEEHKWPYDCVRFLKDFWFCMEDYIPAKVVEYEEKDVHVFVVYERV
jgi:hypothetical protein